MIGFKLYNPREDIIKRGTAHLLNVSPLLHHSVTHFVPWGHVRKENGKAMERKDA